MHAFGGGSKSFLRFLLSSRKRMKKRKSRLLAGQWRSALEKGSTSELRGWWQWELWGKATMGGWREVDSPLIAGISKHFLAYYMRGIYCSPRELGQPMLIVVCKTSRAVSFPEFPSHIGQVC